MGGDMKVSVFEGHIRAKSATKRNDISKIIVMSLAALMILSVFAGMLMAEAKGTPRTGDGILLYETQNVVLTQEQKECCANPQILNSSDSHSSSSEIDSALSGTVLE